MKQFLDGSSLNLPLASHELSQSFIVTCVEHGYNTLNDLLAIPLTELVKMRWFTPEFFKEFTSVMAGIPFLDNVNWEKPREE